jgi:hypothetical protein
LGHVVPCGDFGDALVEVIVPCVRNVVHLILDMANEIIDDGPSQGRPATQDLPHPWSALETGHLFEDTDLQNGTHDTEIASDVDWEMMSEMPTVIERPDTPPSPNPWSTSATLPVSQEPEAREELSVEGANDTQQTDDISPTPWSTSATLPVSPEHENHGPGEDKIPEAPPPVVKKKVFSTAEYKVAFSHFLVCMKQYQSRLANIRNSEFSHTRQKAINSYSLGPPFARYAQA